MQLPKRKPTRLKNYNYSTVGFYFVTVCVKDRKNLLGNIVGDGACDVPKMMLSEYGCVLEEYLTLLNNKYSHISVDKYEIMPNHFHLIINLSQGGLSQAPNPTNNEISKFMSLLKRECNQKYKYNIWQRGFHDHIIRGEADYLKIWQYIDTNVLKWEQDSLYQKNE